MKKVIVLLVMMLMVLTGCQKTEEYVSVADNTIAGRSVFVDGGGVALIPDGKTLYSATFQNGTLTDFAEEAKLDSKVNAIAAYEDYVYISNDKGLERCKMDIYTEGTMTAESEPLLDKKLDGQFEIYDDRLYFIINGELCCMPVDGGKVTEIVKAYDFEITDIGIIYANDGELRLMDDKEDKKLAKIPKDAEIQLTFDKIYFVDGKKVKYYSVLTDKVKKAKTRKKIDNKIVWPYDHNFVYRSTEPAIRLVTDEGESASGDNEKFPNKVNGAIYSSWMVTQSGGQIYVYDLQVSCVGIYNIKDMLEVEQ